MREPNEPANDDFEDVASANDGEINLEQFIVSMEDTTARRAAPSKPERAGWQRVDDWRDARWLRQQLDDWDDWKE